jgi:hypothetical protein
MNQINPEQEKEKGPTKLENAAKALGIMTTLANTAAGGYKAFVTDPAQTELLKSKSALELLKTKQP